MKKTYYKTLCNNVLTARQWENTSASTPACMHACTGKRLGGKHNASAAHKIDSRCIRFTQQSASTNKILKYCNKLTKYTPLWKNLKCYNAAHIHCGGISADPGQTFRVVVDHQFQVVVQIRLQHSNQHQQKWMSEVGTCEASRFDSNQSFQFDSTVLGQFKKFEFSNRPCLPIARSSQTTQTINGA